MANPFLESLGEPPKACMTKSSHPTANLKEKGNSDLPLLCLNYLSPILWLLVCVFTIWYFRPLAMQKEICQAHNYPVSTTQYSIDGENPMLLKFMTIEQISSSTWLRKLNSCYYIYNIFPCPNVFFILCIPRAYNV